MPLKNIKKIFQLSTQFARIPASSVVNSQFPAMTSKRTSDPVATDTVHCDTPSVENGSKCAQSFVGSNALVTDVHGMKSDNTFFNSLEDTIRKRGDMGKSTSDSAQS